MLTVLQLAIILPSATDVSVNSSLSLSMVAYTSSSTIVRPLFGLVVNIRRKLIFDKSAFPTTEADPIGIQIWFQPFEREDASIINVNSSTSFLPELVSSRVTLFVRYDVSLTYNERCRLPSLYTEISVEFLKTNALAPTSGTNINAPEPSSTYSGCVVTFALRIPLKIFTVLQLIIILP